MMELTSGQQEALVQVKALQAAFPNGGAIGVIAGFAGSGKSTLIKHINQEYNNNCFVVTPTGKAALRVKEISETRAKTIHRWQYTPTEDEETGDITFKRKELTQIERPSCGFLIVDEASMVGLDIFKDLYQFCKRLELNLILIGDGFQLPPVEMDEKKRGFSVFNDDFPANFKVHLTEIHRQALDSPIIRASMAVRTGKWVEECFSELKTVKKEDLDEEGYQTWNNEGVVICHRNATRNALNRSIRQKHVKEGVGLCQSEPLLITRNNYFYDIYNGEVLSVITRPEVLKNQVVRDRQNNSSIYVNYLTTNIDTGIGRKEVLLGDREVMDTLGEVSQYSVYRDARILLKEQELQTKMSYVNANLGYTLTAHRAQGSEFVDGIVVFEPSLRLNSSDGRRWSYTSISRFRKRVRICWT